MRAEHRALLERAQAEARRRRHATTDLAHLLTVLLDVRAEAEALHARGIDPLELRDRAEAHLADLPVASYREPVDAPADAAVERLLTRSGGGVRALFRRRPLIEALLIDRAIARLVVELLRGEDHRYIVERARAFAITLDHRLFGVEHVFRSLLDLPSFHSTLERAGGRAEALRAAVEAALAAPHLALDGAPIADATLRRMLAARDGPQSIRELCIRLARLDEAEPYWSAAGITRAAFLQAIHVP